MPSVVRRSAVPVVVALSALLLAGCVVQPEPVVSDDGPNPGGDPTGQPVPTLTAEPQSTPIDQTCAELIPDQVVYDYNPNFGAIDPFTPASGSAGDSALDYDGVACRWQNLTSGANIDLSAAHLDEGSIVSLQESAAASGEPVSGVGAEAYFAVLGNGVGSLAVFQGGYWLVLESPEFGAAADAGVFVDSALAGLGA